MGLHFGHFPFSSSFQELRYLIFFRSRRFTRADLFRGFIQGLPAFFLSLGHRGQHEPHVSAFHPGRHIDLAYSFAIPDDLVQNFPAPVEKGHLAPPEKDSDLYPEAGKEKILDRAHLEIVIMEIDLRSHLHLLDHLSLGLLPGILVSLLLLELELAVIQYPADRRIGLARNLDKIQLTLFSECQCPGRWNNSDLDPLVIDQENFLNPNFFVDARFIAFFSYNSSPPSDN